MDLLLGISVAGELSRSGVTKLPELSLSSLPTSITTLVEVKLKGTHTGVAVIGSVPHSVQSHTKPNNTVDLLQCDMYRVTLVHISQCLTSTFNRTWIFPYSLACPTTTFFCKGCLTGCDLFGHKGILQPAESDIPSPSILVGFLDAIMS